MDTNLEPRRINASSINDQGWFKLLTILNLKRFKLKCRLRRLEIDFEVMYDHSRVLNCRK